MLVYKNQNFLVTFIKTQAIFRELSKEIKKLIMLLYVVCLFILKQFISIVNVISLLV